MTTEQKNRTARRDFLKSVAVGAGVVAVGATPNLRANEVAAAKKPKKVFSTDPCAMISLTPEVKCTRLGFGCGMKGWERNSNLKRMDEAKAISLLQMAYDRGIRTFDMADLYGVHSLVAKALRGKPRDSYTLISKTWYHANGLPEKERLAADVVVKRFLEECRTDYIDIVQIHCMNNGEWTTQFADHLETMTRLKKAGLIRAHGVSCHANSALEAAAKLPSWTDVVHVRINHEGVNMDGSVADVERVTKLCHEAGIGTIAMKVIGEGKFSDSLEKRKKSVAYLTGLDCIDTMIVAFDEEQHITELLENVREALETHAKQQQAA